MKKSWEAFMTVQLARTRNTSEILSINWSVVWIS